MIESRTTDAEWRRIPSFVDYEINRAGDVRRITPYEKACRYGPGHIFRAKARKRPVHLLTDPSGKRVGRSVRSLVREAFPEYAWGKLQVPADAEWRKTADYPLYEVNQYGQVRRTIRTRQGLAGELLSGCPDGRPNSYIRYALTRPDGSYRTESAHRLVAFAFLPPPTDPKQTFVAHADGSRQNNHVSNLRWATPRENIHDNWRNGAMLRGETSGQAKLTNRQVREIRTSYRRGCRENGGPALARKHGVSVPTIMRIIDRRNWRHVD